MSSVENISKYLGWLPKGIASGIEKRMTQIPAVMKVIEHENQKITASLEHSLKPYHAQYERHEKLPQDGWGRDKILNILTEMSEKERGRWESGFVSGGIYHGEKEHIEFLNQAYSLHSQSNPLHGDLFPSATKFEAEIVSMVATMMGKGKTSDELEPVGTVTSGGTESILLAMKTYRDKAFLEKGIKAPEMILPESAHAAFDKASQFFGIKQVKIKLNPDFTVDANEVRRKINKNTIVIVGSAPSFPHGIIDPIEALSEIAFEHGLGFHTDACLGGFIIPFAEKLGYPVPKIDFRLRGVTSMSVDTHKYGYAAKGTSVVLYRNEDLRHHQFYTNTEWPGGLYFSPTLAGSRPGGLSAACWAAMMNMGESGYLNATDSILKTAELIKTGIAQIPEIKILGNPLWIIAFGSEIVNIYEVLDQMNRKGWNLNGLHKPACVHIALTLRHTQPGVAERFVSDLKGAVGYIKQNPAAEGGMAPIYGMGGSLPFRGMVSNILKKYLDVVYKV